MQRYERELAVAVEAVREAAGLCRAVGSGIDDGVLKKGDRSPVTVADFGSQALVCRALADAFADDPVIGEEDSAALREADNAHVLDLVVAHVRAIRPAADADQVCHWIDRGGRRGAAERFWTLDPIDGTKGFLRGDQYAVALALVVDGELAVGAMACPNLPLDRGATGRGTIFAAVRGGGAFTEPIAGGERRAIHVSDTEDGAASRFCESLESGHSSHEDSAAIAEALDITTPPARLDSQAKYGLVARGEAEIYMRLPTRPGYVEKTWDHAAGVLIVEEAGGRATDVAGRPLDFSHGEPLSSNRGVIVTNGPLHDRVLAAIEQVGVR